MPDNLRRPWWPTLWLACCASAHATLPADDDQAAAVTAAKALLTPEQHARIQSVELKYRMRMPPDMPPPLMDPCQIYGDGGTQPCTIDYIEIGLEAPAPRPGVCRRDFIAVRPQAATGQRIRPPGGGARLALGSTCATLPAAAFARVSGPHGQDRDDEDDIAAATDLLSWLQRQQAAIRDGLHTGNPGTTPGLFIEHCTTEVAFDRDHEGCDGGPLASFARLPLDRIRFVSRDDAAENARRWTGDAHWSLSLQPDGPGYPLWDVSIDRNDTASSLIRLVRRLPAPA